jgi:hypothetical protein
MAALFYSRRRDRQRFLLQPFVRERSRRAYAFIGMNRTDVSAVKARIWKRGHKSTCHLAAVSGNGSRNATSRSRQ